VLVSSTPVSSTNAVNKIERGVNVCIFYYNLNIYRITAVLKVDKDIITSITASPNVRRDLQN